MGTQILEGAGPALRLAPVGGDAAAIACPAGRIWYDAAQKLREESLSMQPGTTIPCPHCGAKLPVGARFCGDCGKAIAPARQSPRPDGIIVVEPPAQAPPSRKRRAPLPDEVTELDLSTEAAPAPPRSKRRPLPDEATVVDVSAEAAPSQPRGRRPPLPDEVTELDLSTGVAPSQPRSKRPPLPDEITVVDVSAGAAPSQPPRRAPLPDEVTVVDLPGGPLSASQGRNAAPGSPGTAAPTGAPVPGSPLWGAMPGQPTAGTGWPSPAASPSLPPMPYAAPTAGNPSFPGLQSAAPPLSRPPASGAGQPVMPPSPHYPVISGNFPLKKRTVFSSPGGRIALVVLVLLIIAGIVSIYFIIQSINRHGLPNDIPLPTTANYVKTIERLPQDPTDEAWLYTMSNMQPSQVIDFYQAQLPGNGWGKLMRAIGVGSPGAQSGGEIVACKGNKAVQVHADQASIEGVAPPSGGVTLEIILRPASEVQNCA